MRAANFKEFIVKSRFYFNQLIDAVEFIRLFVSAIVWWKHDFSIDFLGYFCTISKIQHMLASMWHNSSTNHPLSLLKQHTQKTHTHAFTNPDSELFEAMRIFDAGWYLIRATCKQIDITQHILSRFIWLNLVGHYQFTS